MYYDNLPQINKLEIFKYVLNITKGNDLRDLFWLKSWSSEIWLKKRCEYMRSLGVMSIAGYILGLGDRHPCNLMIHRYSGKVVHIDFGDCFEVAMLRDKLPEKVPFRLTRMLINAMEISGFEGNFRITCQSVMHLLREHKESVMAVLEALAYDPLMNWRLLEEKEKENQKQNEQKQQNQTVSTPTSINDSTTNFTPEICDKSGVARIESSNANETALKTTTKKRVTFKQQNDEQQIHQIHAKSLQSKKSKSLASSLKIEENMIEKEEENEYNNDSSSSLYSSYTTTPNTMSYSRRQRLSSLWMPRELDDTDSRENVNKKALQVLQRVSMKLRGRDFNFIRSSNNDDKEISNVKEQVQRLFIEAANHENLSQAYLGWCPLW